MDGEISTKLIDGLVATGPGGILAAVIFYFYRIDRKMAMDRTITLNQALLELGEGFREIVQENTKAIQANTDVIRELCRQSKNG